MVAVQIGYAADPQGNGVAYARLVSSTGERLVRAPFRVRRFSGLGAREISYGALGAVAAILADRGVMHVEFRVPDAELVADRLERRPLPAPLVLPYVRLGCVLNRFKRYSVEHVEDPDLTSRASAEVALNHVA
jgi:hypothetical protein